MRIVSRNYESLSKQPNGLVNLSGKPDWQIWPFLGDLPVAATRVIVFSDFGPTQSGMVPTGTLTEFDSVKSPEWLKRVAGTDIGCGMTLAFFREKISRKHFMSSQKEINALAGMLISNDELIGLGGGNHFLDFVTTEDGKLGVVVHTGSHRDQQCALTKVVGSITNFTNQHQLDRYWKMYGQVVTNAEDNRRGILALVEKIYGKLGDVFDKPHNTIKRLSDTNFRIYKGTVDCEGDEDPIVLLPSSMATPMLLYKPTKDHLKRYAGAVPHGTGRIIPRGEVDKQLFEELYGANAKPGKINSEYMGHLIDGVELLTPAGMGLPITELPHVYRTIDETTTILVENGIIGDILGVLTPIAYLGHL